MSKEKSINDLVFGRNSNPYNIALPKWTSLWWKWLVSIPKERSPASDATGQFCNTSQYNPKVWFLAGTFGGSAVRNCTIPYGRAILFPILTSVFSFVRDPQIKSEEELTKAAVNDVDTVQSLNLIIDEITFKDLHLCRVRTEPFDHNIDGVETRAVSDGYWIFLKPPNIGNHRIYFMARNVDFFNEVTYHISIVSNNLS